MDLIISTCLCFAFVYSLHRLKPLFFKFLIIKAYWKATFMIYARFCMFAPSSSRDFCAKVKAPKLQEKKTHRGGGKTKSRANATATSIQDLLVRDCNPRVAPSSEDPALMDPAVMDPTGGRRLLRLRVRSDTGDQHRGLPRLMTPPPPPLSSLFHASPFGHFVKKFLKN